MNRQHCHRVLVGLGVVVLSSLFSGCGKTSAAPNSRNPSSSKPIVVHVVDIDHQPITGAQIAYKRDWHSTSYITPTDLMTDAMGVVRFEIDSPYYRTDVRITTPGYYQEVQAVEVSRHVTNSTVFTVTLERLP